MMLTQIHRDLKRYPYLAINKSTDDLCLVSRTAAIILRSSESGRVGDTYTGKFDEKFFVPLIKGNGVEIIND